MIQHTASCEIYQKLDFLKDMDCEIEVINELRLSHERSKKECNTGSRDIKFEFGKVVYRRKFQQSSKIGNNNPKLTAKLIKWVVLSSIGNAMYELRYY